MTRELWTAGVVRVKRGRNPVTGAALWGVYWVDEDNGHHMQAFFASRVGARIYAESIRRKIRAWEAAVERENAQARSDAVFSEE